MRIGIDARELCGRRTGVGRYLESLLNEWTADERGRQHEFVLYAPQPINVNRLREKIVPGRAGVWWEQLSLARALRADRLDVFFAPAYTAPVALRVPLVVTIHDLSFVAHPEWFRFREGLRRRWLTRSAARRARAIVTVSEFARREVIERLRIPEERVHAIPHGAPRPRPRGSSASTAPMLLSVGSIFNRRRIPDLIRAFGRVARAHQDAILEIVGDNRSYPYQDVAALIESEALAARIRWHAYLPEAELQALYGRARGLAFLSEYEGFGLPPIEALAADVPPVLLDTAVAHETCGDAAFYVAKGDIAAAASAIERALFDEGARARVLAAAPEVLARYSWARAARDTLAVIEEAAEGSAQGRTLQADWKSRM